MTEKGKDVLVISLVAGAHCMSHFSQLLFAPLFPYMKEELGVSYAALGFLVAVYYTLSAVFQPVAGFVVDRYGPRAVLFGGLGLLVAGMLVAALSYSYAGLAAGIALSGLGNSVFHPADFAILNGRVSAARVSYAFSAHSMVGYLGFAVSPAFAVGVASVYGWHAALLAGTVLTAAVVGIVALFASHLKVVREAPSGARKPLFDGVQDVLSTPVVMCFLYFCLFSAALTGIMSFGVAATVEQYKVGATLASSALTAYLVCAAIGIAFGGVVAAKAKSHEHVAGLGLAVNAAALLIVATGMLPGAAVPLAMGIGGFAQGIIAPSRDMIVRSVTPPGATGRVFGFVYTGLDVGSFATPVAYGWLMDMALPQAVFYLAFALNALAIFTVLQLPARKPAAAQSTARS
jgi:MFS family permease